MRAIGTVLRVRPAPEAVTLVRNAPVTLAHTQGKSRLPAKIRLAKNNNNVNIIITTNTELPFTLEEA